MPNFRKHLLAGIVVAVAFGIGMFHIWGVGYWMPIGASITVLVFASLLPDIDHPLAYIRRIVEVGLLLAAVYFTLDGKTFWVIGIAFFICLLWFLTHRGLLHSILIPTLSGIYYFLHPEVLVVGGFTFGYLTHLLLDMVLHEK